MIRHRYYVGAMGPSSSSNRPTCTRDCPRPVTRILRHSLSYSPRSPSSPPYSGPRKRSTGGFQHETNGSRRAQKKLPLLR